MSNCLSSEALHRYRAGRDLSPEEIRAWDAHLSTCLACREALFGVVPETDERLKSRLLPSPLEARCLEDAQIDDYVRQRLAPEDREHVEHHLALCPHCRTEVEHHAAFHHEMHGFDWAAAHLKSGWRDRYAAWNLRWSGTAAALLTRWNRFSLSGRILAALILGAIVGRLAGPRLGALAEVGPDILHLLSGVALPLIFIGVIHALMRAQRVEGKARRLVGLLLTNSIVAACIGLAAGRLLHPDRIMKSLVPGGPVPSLLKAPDNLLQPLLENNVLLAILFAVGFGITLRRVRAEQIAQGQTAYRALEDLFSTAFRCLQLLLQWIISLMPLAVFALAASLVAQGGLNAFRSLGSLVAATLIALLLQTLYYVVRLRLETGADLPAFFKATRSALLLAFSTASSAATLPVTYARAREGLKITEESVGLGVLVGGSINRDGTALFEALGVVFISQLLGVHLTLVQQAVIVLMAVVASLCAPGVPEAGLVTMVLIFQSLGMPQASHYIVLLIPLDWLLDRARTTVNVMGHLTTACLLDGRREQDKIEV